MPVDTASEPIFGPMQRQVNKMMDQMQKGFYGFCANETWTPNVNLYETQRSYLVCVDLAGVVKNAIDLVVSDGRLTLRGTRAVPEKSGDAEEGEEAAGAEARIASRRLAAQDKRRGSAAPAAASATAPPQRHAEGESSEDASPRYRVHLMEIDHGQFVREVELPDDVRKDDISATYRNGLLWIELPKRQAGGE